MIYISIQEMEKIRNTPHNIIRVAGIMRGHGHNSRTHLGLDLLMPYLDLYDSVWLIRHLNLKHNYQTLTDILVGNIIKEALRQLPKHERPDDYEAWTEYIYLYCKSPRVQEDNHRLFTLAYRIEESYRIGEDDLSRKDYMRMAVSNILPFNYAPIFAMQMARRSLKGTAMGTTNYQAEVFLDLVNRFERFPEETKCRKL